MLARRKQIAAVAIVLIGLGGVLAIWLNSRRASDSAQQPSSQVLDTTPIPFGYKTAWVAVHSQDQRAVAAALGLRDVHAAGWHPGLDQAIDGGSGLVFVAPPVNGWVLAVGKALLGDAKYEDTIKALSRQFGEAQYYESMRVADAYAWAQARDGEVMCLFDGANGREPRREGFEHELESVVRLRFVEKLPPDEKDRTAAERRQAPFPDEEDVLRVADVWSVNPMDMEKYPEAQYSGLVGRYPR